MTFPKKELEALWSPWRVEYFEAEYRAGKDFLLEAASSTNDLAHLVIHREATAFLIMNKYPYSCGHLMAVPNRKVCEIQELRDAEMLDLWRLCSRAETLLRIAVRAQGFNIGLNVGRAGGAGVLEHMHWHIVPRWEGDSNFMAVVGNTRILPQALEPLYHKLKEINQSLPPDGSSCESSLAD
jgi:ATP adenylyltransferase